MEPGDLYFQRAPRQQWPSARCVPLFAPFREHWTELLSRVWRKRRMTYSTSYTSQTWPVGIGYSTGEWQLFSKGAGSRNSALWGLGEWGVKFLQEDHQTGRSGRWGKELDSPTMIPQALTNPISFFRATPPPPEPVSGLASGSLPPGWFFSVLFRCLAPFSMFLSRISTSERYLSF